MRQACFLKIKFASFHDWSGFLNFSPLPFQEGRVESRDLEATAVRVHLVPSLLPRQLVPVLPSAQPVSQPAAQPEPPPSKPQPGYSDTVGKSKSIRKYLGKVSEI